MTRKGILIGVLCLALSSVAGVANALDLKAKFFSYPTSFGTFLTLDAAGNPVKVTGANAGEGVANNVTSSLVMEGILSLNVPAGFTLADPATDTLLISKNTVLTGTLDLFFPCKAGSKACVNNAEHPFSNDLKVNATYPIVSVNGDFEALVRFKTSPVTAVIFDPVTDAVNKIGKDRVIFTQDANPAAAATIRVTNPSLKIFTLKFGKISVFYNAAGQIDTAPAKGIQATYSLVDASGAVVDSGKAFFFQ